MMCLIDIQCTDASDAGQDGLCLCDGYGNYIIYQNMKTNKVFVILHCSKLIKLLVNYN